MDVTELAFYAGYAFCQAVNVQSVLEPDALMVPFVVEWSEKSPSAKPYPAKTQKEAVQLQADAIGKIEQNFQPWSAGKDGLLSLSNGSKADVLVITSGSHELGSRLEVLHMYTTKPFALTGNFIVQPPYDEFLKKENGSSRFFASFIQGIQAHNFSGECMSYVANKS
tara:strand:- start:296 stop:796 length:501 start_codon:yes stop_codon:yes gene_type:complete